MNLWDGLIYLEDRTLNLLQPETINTILSVYNMIRRIFDFNRTPMVPPGWYIIVHEKQGKRGS